MRKLKLFEILKNQKGLTGTDIIVATTIILVTITVVSMVYVNTTLETRNTTRTAGATRIATNILENIEKLSYDEFVKEFNIETEGQTKQTLEEYYNYYLLDGGEDGKLFSTKIPKGYSVYLKAESSYGTHTDTKEQFDLVREINLKIVFNIGDKNQKIDFQSVKKREIIEEANKPNTEYLTSEGILKAGMNYYPVKYLESSNAYIKINENDTSWYNYSNKEWATVLVSKKAENELFDVNGKFVGEINISKTDENYTEKFVWIPRFFTKTVTENEKTKEVFFVFAYLGNGNNKIIPTTLNSLAGGTSSLTINTFQPIEEGINTDIIDFEGKTGKWVSSEIQDQETKETGIIKDEMAKILNESKFGPYMEH